MLCAPLWGFVLGARATSVLGGVSSACCRGVISSGGSMNSSSVCGEGGAGPRVERVLAPADRGAC